MRILIAFAFGCALVIGLSNAGSSGVSARGALPATELSHPSAEDATDEAPPENETNYECKYSPYCQRASQCTAYCGGGGAVCSNGCCACAS
jgi:hypothetical protein